VVALTRDPEFVRASDLRTDSGPQVRRHDHRETADDDAPEADECRVCGADGPDCRRVRLPDRDREKTALCAACRYGVSPMGREELDGARAAFEDLKVALELVESAGDKHPNRYQDQLADLHGEVDDFAAEVWEQEVDDDE